MYRSLKALVEHYEDHHLDLRMAAPPLLDKAGAQIGALDEITLRNKQLYIRGWCLSGMVALRCGTSYAEQEPSLSRHDIAKFMGSHPHVGFEATLHAQGRKLLLEFGPDEDRQSLALPLPGIWAQRMARAKLGLRLLGDLTLNTPRLLASLSKGRMRFHQTLKTALRLGHRDVTPKLEPRILAASETQAMSNAPARTDLKDAAGITIILPVYNAKDVLMEALRRVEAHTDMPWRLVLIEDGSTDPALRPWLRDWASQDHGAACLGVELMEHDDNLGFIHSVNEGFARALDLGDHVVLLTAGTLVPAGWASRLLAPFLTNTTVATVTPMSNDASILSAPVINTPNPLSPGQIDRIDRTAATLPSAHKSVETPTGVGFCMAINIRYLRQHPSFDMRFGRGYGEEVDWCRRVSGLGGRHVAAPNLYVGHQSGSSFHTPEKHALIDQNGRMLSQRYPRYEAEVQRFIRNDPLRSERLTLALAWLDSCPDTVEVPVFIAHSMGGGADRYLQHRLQHREHRHGVVLRMGGRDRCRVEVTTPQGQITASTNDLALIVQLVQGITRRRVIYSCAVDDPDPLALPRFLVDLAGPCPLDILFHDYLALTPSFNLLEADGTFRGVPIPGSESKAHVAHCPNGKTVPLAEWRNAWGVALGQAERLVVFSNDSRTHVTKAYPEHASRIVLDPHTPLEHLPQITPVPSDRLVIGVLGNIVAKKGIRVVQALSHRVQECDKTDLVVLGRTDPSFPLHKATQVHGSYMVADLPMLIKRYKINTWLVPSICPETFSYVTQECLMTGLPVISFDLGAQGEAVRRAPNGITLPIPPQGAHSDAAINAILQAARGARIVPA